MKINISWSIYKLLPGRGNLEMAGYEKKPKGKKTFEELETQPLVAYFFYLVIVQKRF